MGDRAGFGEDDKTYCPLCGSWMPLWGPEMGEPTACYKCQQKSNEELGYRVNDLVASLISARSALDNATHNLERISKQHAECLRAARWLFRNFGAYATQYQRDDAAEKWPFLEDDDD